MPFNTPPMMGPTKTEYGIGFLAPTPVIRQAPNGFEPMIHSIWRYASSTYGFPLSPMSCANRPRNRACESRWELVPSHQYFSRTGMKDRKSTRLNSSHL